MKKACLFVDDYLMNNKIFEPGAFRDDINAKYIELKSAFTDRGYELATQDINTIQESAIVIYATDMPRVLPEDEHVQKSFLLIWESAFIKPENFDPELHKKFRRVFTWHDEFVDHDKYIKINFSHRFPTAINKDLGNKKKLFTLIAGNKKPPHTDANDLYSERLKAIRWFEKNHPDEFDLYGVGWDRHRFYGPRLIRALNRLPWLAKVAQWLRSEQFPSYRGSVSNKKRVMEQYRFCICYENVSGIPGYITEKIFDSFFAGCVPIYWGASNIKDYIPNGCLIDARRFGSYDELFSYTSRMQDDSYRTYLDNIEAFLKSEGALPFRAEWFGRQVCNGILETYD